MSAFVVSKEHIDAIVALSIKQGNLRFTWFSEDPDSIEWTGDYSAHTAAMREIHREANLMTADSIGQMLAFENAASVLYRYPDHDNSEYVPEWTTDDSYRYPGNVRRPTPVEGLKLIACLEYQSCEHPGWKSSEARRFLEALRDDLINRLPGYEEAPWEWSVKQPA